MFWGSLKRKLTLDEEGGAWQSMVSTRTLILTFGGPSGAPIIQVRMRYKSEQEGGNTMILGLSGFLKEVWTSNLVGQAAWVRLLNSWLFERNAKGLNFRWFCFRRALLRVSLPNADRRNRRWSNRTSSVSLNGRRVSSTFLMEANGTKGKKL